MNKFKVLAGLLLFTCILSLANVKASGYLGIINVTIPATNGNWTSSSAEKTTYSNQYVLDIGAIDSLSGDERAVGARLKEVTTYYVELIKDQYVQLFNDNAGLGQIPANYKLQVRCKKWTLTTAHFTGMWVLDDYLLP